MNLSEEVAKVKVAKGVNDLLNHYVGVLDTKASAFLAGNVAAASFLLKEMPIPLYAKVLYFTALTCHAASVIMAGTTIFPRLPKPSNSVIFWGDIARLTSLETYTKLFNSVLEAEQMDEQYTAQNYFTARVLKRKYHCLRWCIALFFFALFAAFPAFLVASKWDSPQP